MAAPAQGSLQKEFPLPAGILGPGSAAAVTVSATTASDVLDAIVSNEEFPTRPDGKLELGSVALEASGGKQISFDAGKGTVGFEFSTAFKTGAGVYDQATDAVA